jgi:hypothetical protein
MNYSVWGVWAIWTAQAIRKKIDLSFSEQLLGVFFQHFVGNV